MFSFFWLVLFILDASRKSRNLWEMRVQYSCIWILRCRRLRQRRRAMTTTMMMGTVKWPHARIIISSFNWNAILESIAHFVCIFSSLNLDGLWLPGVREHALTCPHAQLEPCRAICNEDVCAAHVSSITRDVGTTCRPVIAEECKND